jgi:hypothetical protein
LFNEAEATLENIEPARGIGHVLATAEYHQVSGLMAVARGKMEAGEQDAARETLDQALQVARSTDDEGERFQLMSGIARELAKLGDFRLARKVAQETGSVDVLIWLAAEHLKGNRRQAFEDALREARQQTSSNLGREGSGAMHHAQIADLLLRVDRHEDAEQTIRQLLSGARKMEPSIYKFVAYALAAGFYFHTDQPDRLWQHVAGMQDPLERAFACASVAQALIAPEQWGSEGFDEGTSE